MKKKKRYRLGKRILAALLAIGLLLGDGNLPVLAAGNEGRAEDGITTVLAPKEVSGGDVSDGSLTTPDVSGGEGTQKMLLPETEKEEPVPVKASPLTALYIRETIDGDPVSVDVTGDAEGDGWSYSAATGILTLEGFNGGGIEAEGTLNIVLSQSNIITVSKHEQAGLKATGGVTIDKQNSDADDVLTITNIEAGYALIYYTTYVTLNGGTLRLIVKEGDLGGGDNGYINAKITVNNTANLECTAKNFAGTTPYFLSDLESRGSGTIRVESSGNMAAVGSLYVYGGGNISLTAAGKDGKPGVACYHMEYHSGATAVLTCKGYMGVKQSKYELSEKFTLLAPAGTEYLLYNTKTEFCDNSQYAWFADAAGNLLTEATFGATQTPVFSFTDSPIFDLPEGKVGYSVDMKMYHGLHGVQLSYNSTSVEYTMKLKEGSVLPEGLVVTSDGRIYGTYAAECEPGTATIVATKTSPKETIEFTIAYGRVIDKDRFLTVGEKKVNTREDASGSGWQYTAADKTLLLAGYNGGGIASEEALHLLLQGENTITVSESGQAGLKADGGVTIDKQNSDAEDVLTITNIEAGYTLIYYTTYVTLNGGTLRLIVKEGDLGEGENGYINAKITVNSTANLECTAKNFAGTTPYFLSDLESRGSGTIRVESSGNMAVVGSLYVYGGGNISLTAAGKDGKPGVACYHMEYHSGATAVLTCKGYMGVKQSKYELSEKITLLAPAGTEYLLYNTKTEFCDNSQYAWFADAAGNLLTEATFGATQTPVFSFTDSPIFDLPEGKVGYSVNMKMYHGLHGVQLSYSSTSVEYTMKLKEGSVLPEGLVVTSDGRIYGTYEAECEPGTATIVATKTSTGEQVEFTIAYGRVTVPSPVTGVSLDETVLTFAENESKVLTATVTPADATITDVAFTISDRSVADITPSGNKVTVTGKKPGTAVITVSSVQGGLKDTCTVTVRAGKPEIVFDVKNNTLSGFYPGRTYEIRDKADDGLLKAAFSGVYRLPVEETWFGKTLSIREKGTAGGDSEPFFLTVAHVYGDTYKSNATHHWKECACGEQEEMTAHSFSWKVETEPTDTTDGSKYRYCTVCEYVEESSKGTRIPKYTLESITVKDITLPAEGAAPDYGILPGEEECYGFEAVSWSLDGNPLTAESLFENGKAYTLKMKVVQAGSYHFPADMSGVSVILDEVDDASVTEKLLTADGGDIYLKITFRASGEPVSLSGETLRVSLEQNYVFTGSPIEPAFTVTYTGEGVERSLRKEKHYTVSFADNEEPGQATVTITGVGLYAGEVVYHFFITKPVSTLTVEEKSFVYTGSPIDPGEGLVVKDRDRLLTRGEDYVIKSLENNTEPGCMKLVLAGGSNGKYTGEGVFDGELSIVGKDLSGAVITGTKDVVYTGDPFTFKLTVKLGKTLLIEGTDYEVSYTDNVKAGTARVTVTGIGRYRGEAAKTFAISPKKLTAAKLGTLPTQIYTGAKLTPAIFITDGNTVLTEGVDYQVFYSNNIDPGTATALIRGIGSYSGEKSLKFQIRYGLGKTIVSHMVNELEYNGKEQKPEPVLTDASGYVLKKNQDYTISYRNNKDAGTASVLIKGKGLYEGQVTLRFQITPLSFTEESLTVSSIKNQVYNGSPVKVKPSVKYGKVTLKADRDYVISYRNNLNAGTASVVITGKGNYTGEAEVSFNIEAKAIGKCKVAAIPVQPLKGGKAEPAVSITDGKRILTENRDYVLSYANHTACGTATVTITGKGNYSGLVTKTFSVRKSIEDAALTGFAETSPYTGKAVTFPVVLTADGEILRQGKDFSVTYRNNQNAGEALLLITGKGDYAGSIEKRFTIRPLSLEDGLGAVADIKTVVYNGKTKQPSVTVSYNGKKLAKNDYTVTYENNLSASGEGTARVIITGKGNYRGRLVKEFLIRQKEIAKCSISVSDAGLDLTAGEAKPVITVKDGTMLLTEGSDYTVSFSGNTALGTGTALITGKGNYAGTQTKTFRIKTDISAAIISGLPESVTYTGKAQKPAVTVTLDGTLLKAGRDYTVSYENNLLASENTSASGSEGKARVVITGKGNYGGRVIKSFIIRSVYLNESSVTITPIKAQTYNGKEQTPSFTIRYGKVTLKKDTDYTVRYLYNESAGEALAAIQFIGGYRGYINQYFTIQPRKISSVRVAAIQPQSFQPGTFVPSVTLTDGKKTLSAGVDYMVSCPEKNAGKTTVVITGIGNYTGSISRSMTVTPMDITGVNVRSIPDQSYTGRPVLPEVTLYATTSAGRVVLKENVDYICVYRNNTETGTATVIISGCGNYTGSREVKFRITE